MRRSSTAAVVLLATTALLLAGGEECPGNNVPVLDDDSLEEAYGSCTSVAGDMIVGFANCSFQCNVTSLSPLTGLQSINGSLIIQCCHLLVELSGPSDLTDIGGTLRVYYNERLDTVSGFNGVTSLGSLEISQNPNLTQVSALSSLGTVNGHLQIDHNQRLVDLDGLSNIRTIGGASLVAGHALNVLYNPSLLDLRWLRNLTRIEFGTVHIEGNSALCYAGYPQWTEGGFNTRPPAGDRGIDWRRLLGSGVPRWQYSWGVLGGGYPTLVVQYNAEYEECSEAMCHEACEEGAGCLGPLNPDLCGSCAEGFCEIGATPTTVSCDPTPIPYWPPTEFPYNLVFGILFALCGLVLLGLVVLGGWVMYRICKRLRAGRKDTLDIVNEEMEMVGVELRRRNTQSSGIIAGTSPSVHQPAKSRTAATERSQKRGNVMLTSVSYRLRPLSPPPEHSETPPTATPTPPPTSHSPPITSSTSPTPLPTVTPPPPPTSHSLPVTSDDSPTPLPTSTTVTTPPAIPTPASPSVQQLIANEEVRKSLQSIPEDLEEEEKEKEGGEEEADGPVSTAPVRRLNKHDTLTRLQKGESIIIQMTFPRSQVKLKKEIGKGDFGLVIFAEARKLVSGEKKSPVVVKQLKENLSKQEREAFLRPVEAMSCLQHPNVLSLLGVCVDGPAIMILMEYCPHGSLKTYLVRKRREAAAFREGGKLISIACQMAAGLTYLHSKSIAHNDFAVRSCLVSDTESVKLGDYGLTRQVFEEDYYSRGSGQKAWPVRWMAPEQMIVKGSTVLDSNPVSTTTNVWSFGVSLWEVGTFAQWPYFDLSNEEVIDTVQSSRQCILENPFQHSDLHSPLYDIMQLCWKPAEERPTMADVLQRLENLRDDIARNTPSSRKRKSILSHSLKTTPNTTPTNGTPNNTPHTLPRPKRATPTNTKGGTLDSKKKATPTEPLPKKAMPTEPLPKKAMPTEPLPKKATEPLPKKAMPTEPLPKKATPTEPLPKKVTPTQPHPKATKSYSPRRPAPKIPEEGSLKRGSTTKTTQVQNAANQQQHIPNDAHQVPNDAHLQRHPLETAVIAGETDKQPQDEPMSSEHNHATAGMGVMNPGFAERGDEGGITGASGKEGGNELGVERDVERGVLFVNEAAEEGEEEGEVRGTEGGIQDSGSGAWDLEDGQEWEDEDFILEPPIDFSQPGMEEEEDDDLPQDLYNPRESLCTSIDDFEPILEPPPSPKTQQTRADSYTAESVSDVSSTGRGRVDSKSKKKQRKKEGKRGRREKRGDGTQESPLLTYHTRRDIPPRVMDEGGGGEVREGWNETDFQDEEEDSRYRKPTGRMAKALLKRAPSWSRSGTTEGDDNPPNVVYDDDVSALIW